MGDRFGNLTIDGVRYIKDLKVIELRAELEQRGLSKYGNKKELVQRLSIFEENRQKSTGQPNQETPNQWLENEADLNNDFLREYFKSQKALFQEQVQRKNQIGVSSEPPQESASPPVSKDSSVQFKDVPNYQVSGLSSSAPVTIGTASTIVTSATPPKKSPGRKKKEAKDFKHKQVITSKSSYDADTSVLSSRPSRTSAQASRALSLASFEDDDDDDDSEEKESYDPYSFAHKPRKRGQHRGSRGSHLRRLSGVYNSDPSFKPIPIEEKTVSRETPIHSKVPSLKIKLPEPVPKSNTSIATSHKESNTAKVKYMQDEPLKQNLAGKLMTQICLSPQNAEVSSSVQEDIPESVNKSEPIDAHIDSTSNSSSSNSSASISETEFHVDSNEEKSDLDNDAKVMIVEPSKSVHAKISKTYSIGRSQEWLNEEELDKDENYSDPKERRTKKTRAKKSDHKFHLLPSRISEHDIDIAQKKTSLRVKSDVLSIPRRLKHSHTRKRGAVASSIKSDIIDNSFCIESKLKKDLVNLRLRDESSNKESSSSPRLHIKELASSTVVSKSLRRSSRISKHEKISIKDQKKKEPKLACFASIKSQDLKTSVMQTPATFDLKPSTNPDFIESLKQQIEMPLHIEKFPSSDKSEVTSTSELTGSPEPLKKVKDIPSPFQTSSSSSYSVVETPILDAHIAVEGHLDSPIVSESQSTDSTKKIAGNVSNLTIPSSLSSTCLKSKSTSVNDPSNMKTTVSGLRSPKRSGYFIENLIDDIDKKDIFSEDCSDINSNNSGIDTGSNDIHHIVSDKGLKTKSTDAIDSKTTSYGHPKLKAPSSTNVEEESGNKSFSNSDIAEKSQSSCETITSEVNTKVSVLDLGNNNNNTNNNNNNKEKSKSPKLTSARFPYFSKDLFNLNKIGETHYDKEEKRFEETDVDKRVQDILKEAALAADINESEEIDSEMFSTSSSQDKLISKSFESSVLGHLIKSRSSDQIPSLVSVPVFPVKLPQFRDKERRSSLDHLISTSEEKGTNITPLRSPILDIDGSALIKGNINFQIDHRDTIKEETKPVLIKEHSQEQKSTLPCENLNSKTFSQQGKITITRDNENIAQNTGPKPSSKLSALLVHKSSSAHSSSYEVKSNMTKIVKTNEKLMIEETETKSADSTAVQNIDNLKKNEINPKSTNSKLDDSKPEVSFSQNPDKTFSALEVSKKLEGNLEIHEVKKTSHVSEADKSIETSLKDSLSDNKGTDDLISNSGLRVSVIKSMKSNSLSEDKLSKDSELQSQSPKPENAKNNGSQIVSLNPDISVQVNIENTNKDAILGKFSHEIVKATSDTEFSTNEGKSKKTNEYKSYTVQQSGNNSDSFKEIDSCIGEEKQNIVNINKGSEHSKELHEKKVEMKTQGGSDESLKLLSSNSSEQTEDPLKQSSHLIFSKLNEEPLETHIKIMEDDIKNATIVKEMAEKSVKKNNNVEETKKIFDKEGDDFSIKREAEVVTEKDSPDNKHCAGKISNEHSNRNQKKMEPLLNIKKVTCQRDTFSDENKKENDEKRLAAKVAAVVAKQSKSNVEEKISKKAPEIFCHSGKPSFKERKESIDKKLTSKATAVVAEHSTSNIEKDLSKEKVLKDPSKSNKLSDEKRKENNDKKLASKATAPVAECNKSNDENDLPNEKLLKDTSQGDKFSYKKRIKNNEKNIALKAISIVAKQSKSDIEDNLLNEKLLKVVSQSDKFSDEKRKENNDKLATSNVAEEQRKSNKEDNLEVACQSDKFSDKKRKENNDKLASKVTSDIAQQRKSDNEDNLSKEKLLEVNCESDKFSDQKRKENNDNNKQRKSNKEDYLSKEELLKDTSLGDEMKEKYNESNLFSKATSIVAEKPSKSDNENDLSKENLLKVCQSDDNKFSDEKSNEDNDKNLTSKAAVSLVAKKTKKSNNEDNLSKEKLLKVVCQSDKFSDEMEEENNEKRISSTVTSIVAEKQSKSDKEDNFSKKLLEVCQSDNDKFSDEKGKENKDKLVSKATSDVTEKLSKSNNEDKLSKGELLKVVCLNDKFSDEMSEENYQDFASTVTSIVAEKPSKSDNEKFSNEKLLEVCQSDNDKFSDEKSKEDNDKNLTSKAVSVVAKKQSKSNNEDNLSKEKLLKAVCQSDKFSDEMREENNDKNFTSTTGSIVAVKQNKSNNEDNLSKKELLKDTSQSDKISDEMKEKNNESNLFSKAASVVAEKPSKSDNENLPKKKLFEVCQMDDDKFSDEKRKENNDKLVSKATSDVAEEQSKSNNEDNLSKDKLLKVICQSDKFSGEMKEENKNFASTITFDVAEEASKSNNEDNLSKEELPKGTSQGDKISDEIKNENNLFSKATSVAEKPSKSDNENFSKEKVLEVCQIDDDKFSDEKNEENNDKNLTPKAAISVVAKKQSISNNEDNLSKEKLLKVVCQSDKFSDEMREENNDKNFASTATSIVPEKQNKSNNEDNLSKDELLKGISQDDKFSDEMRKENKEKTFFPTAISIVAEKQNKSDNEDNLSKEELLKDTSQGDKFSDQKRKENYDNNLASKETTVVAEKESKSNNEDNLSKEKLLKVICQSGELSVEKEEINVKNLALKASVSEQSKLNNEGKISEKFHEIDCQSDKFSYENEKDNKDKRLAAKAATVVAEQRRSNFEVNIFKKLHESVCQSEKLLDEKEKDQNDKEISEKVAAVVVEQSKSNIEKELHEIVCQSDKLLDEKTKENSKNLPSKAASMVAEDKSYNEDNLLMKVHEVVRQSDKISDKKKNDDDDDLSKDSKVLAVIGEQKNANNEKNISKEKLHDVCPSSNISDDKKRDNMDKNLASKLVTTVAEQTVSNNNENISKEKLHEVFQSFNTSGEKRKELTSKSSVKVAEQSKLNSGKNISKEKLHKVVCASEKFTNECRDDDDDNETFAPREVAIVTEQVKSSNENISKLHDVEHSVNKKEEEISKSGKLTPNKNIVEQSSNYNNRSTIKASSKEGYFEGNEKEPAIKDLKIPLPSKNEIVVSEDKKLADRQKEVSAEKEESSVSKENKPFKLKEEAPFNKEKCVIKETGETSLKNKNVKSSTESEIKKFEKVNSVNVENLIKELKAKLKENVGDKCIFEDDKKLGTKAKEGTIDIPLKEQLNNNNVVSDEKETLMTLKKTDCLSTSLDSNAGTRNEEKSTRKIELTCSDIQIPLSSEINQNVSEQRMKATFDKNENFSLNINQTKDNEIQDEKSKINSDRVQLVKFVPSEPATEVNNATKNLENSKHLEVKEKHSIDEKEEKPSFDAYREKSVSVYDSKNDISNQSEQDEKEIKPITSLEISSITDRYKVRTSITSSSKLLHSQNQIIPVSHCSGTRFSSASGKNITYSLPSKATALIPEDKSVVAELVRKHKHDTSDEYAKENFPIKNNENIEKSSYDVSKRHDVKVKPQIIAKNEVSNNLENNQSVKEAESREKLNVTNVNILSKKNSKKLQSESVSDSQNLNTKTFSQETYGKDPTLQKDSSLCSSKNTLNLEKSVIDSSSNINKVTCTQENVPRNYESSNINKSIDIILKNSEKLKKYFKDESVKELGTVKLNNKLDLIPKKDTFKCETKGVADMLVPNIEVKPEEKKINSDTFNVESFCVVDNKFLQIHDKGSILSSKVSSKSGRNIVQGSGKQSLTSNVPLPDVKRKIEGESELNENDSARDSINQENICNQMKREELLTASESDRNKISQVQQKFDSSVKKSPFDFDLSEIKLPLEKKVPEKKKVASPSLISSMKKGKIIMKDLESKVYPTNESSLPGNMSKDSNKLIIDKGSNSVQDKSLAKGKEFNYAIKVAKINFSLKTKGIGDENTPQPTIEKDPDSLEMGLEESQLEKVKATSGKTIKLVPTSISLALSSSKEKNIKDEVVKNINVENIKEQSPFDLRSIPLPPLDPMKNKEIIKPKVDIYSHNDSKDGSIDVSLFRKMARSKKNESNSEVTVPKKDDSNGDITDIASVKLSDIKMPEEQSSSIPSQNKEELPKSDNGQKIKIKISSSTKNESVKDSTSDIKEESLKNGTSLLDPKVSKASKETSEKASVKDDGNKDSTTNEKKELSNDDVKKTEKGSSEIEKKDDDRKDKRVESKDQSEEGSKSLRSSSDASKASRERTRSSYRRRSRSNSSSPYRKRGRSRSSSSSRSPSRKRPTKSSSSRSRSRRSRSTDRRRSRERDSRRSRHDSRESKESKRRDSYRRDSLKSKNDSSSKKDVKDDDSFPKKILNEDLSKKVDSVEKKLDTKAANENVSKKKLDMDKKSEIQSTEKTIMEETAKDKEEEIQKVEKNSEIQEIIEKSEQENALMEKEEKKTDKPHIQDGEKFEKETKDVTHEEKSEAKTSLEKTDVTPFKSARKVSLSRSKSQDEDKEKPKKKKWGTSAAANSSVDISSSSLKSLVPDVKPLSPSELTLQLESEKESDGESEAADEEAIVKQDERDANTTKEENRKESKQESSNDDEEADDDDEMDGSKRGKSTFSRKRRSITPRDRSRRRVEGSGATRGVSPSSRKRHSKISPDRTPPPSRKIRIVEAGPNPSVKLSIKPARNPVSRVILLQNLVRPFTIKQLKDLLQRTGKLADNGFWIDSIKSKCLALYETEDQALETRMALHGVKWPTINPKNLIVDFSTEDVLKKKLSEAPLLQPQTSVEEPKRERRRMDGPIREWDLAKLGERSPGEREREKERQRREREEERIRERERTIKAHNTKGEKPSKKSSVKSLDDLFNKTKAQPSIYWLPLTSTQIAEKEAQRRKRIDETERFYAEMKAEREKQRAEQEKEAEKRRQKRKEREKEREKEKSARRSRSRSRKRSRSRSRSTRRSPRRSPRRSRRSGSRDARKSNRKSKSNSRSSSRSRS